MDSLDRLTEDAAYSVKSTDFSFIHPAPNQNLYSFSTFDEPLMGGQDILHGHQKGAVAQLLEHFVAYH